MGTLNAFGDEDENTSSGAKSAKFTLCFFIKFVATGIVNKVGMEG